MSTIALIIAGGSGSRMGQDIPKQFICVNDKPIIVYTLEAFQAHPEIDAIEVVCIEGWHDVLKAYARQFGISKLDWITNGGATGQESIRNGVFNLRGIANPNDVVVIHDGIRPLLEDEVLTDVISVCHDKGNAVSSMPYNEQIFILDKDDQNSTKRYIPRDTLRRVSTPQAYSYGELLNAYERAFEEGVGISPSSYTNTMMVELGKTLYFAKGSDRNIKLTTKADIELFKGFLSNSETSWLK